MAIRNKTPFYRLEMFRSLVIQAVVALLLIVVASVAQGKVSAISAGLGAAIALLANLYFMYKAFKFYGARSMAAIVQSFWMGQAGKIFLTAVLFALVFIAVKPLDVVFLFASYIVVHVTSVVTLWLSKDL